MPFVLNFARSCGDNYGTCSICDELAINYVFFIRNKLIKRRKYKSKKEDNLQQTLLISEFKNKGIPLKEVELHQIIKKKDKLLLIVILYQVSTLYFSVRILICTQWKLFD